MTMIQYYFFEEKNMFDTKLPPDGDDGEHAFVAFHLWLIP